MNPIFRARTARALLAGAFWRHFTHASVSRLQIGARVQVIGRPFVRVVPGANISIANDVVLNSSRLGYHAGLFGPVTLIADVPGAAITIGSSSRLNGAIVHAQARVTIGSRVLMAGQATVLDSNGHVITPISDRLQVRDKARPVVIEDDVWIGLGAVILPGAHIGAGSVISANAVVSGLVPPYSVVRSMTDIRSLRDRGAQVGDAEPEV